MARSFNELRKKMSIERQEKNKLCAQEMLTDLHLQELRQTRKLTQQQLAEVLHIKQASISKLEGQTDMYISTLRKFIQAMGGELDLVARFPDGQVNINQFHELESHK